MGHPSLLTRGVMASMRPTNTRWETSSSHAYANPGALLGRRMCRVLLQGDNTLFWQRDNVVVFCINVLSVWMHFVRKLYYSYYL